MTKKEQKIISKFHKELRQIKDDNKSFNLDLLRLKNYENYRQLNSQLQRLRKLNDENKNFQAQSLKQEAIIIRDIKLCFKKYTNQHKI